MLNGDIMLSGDSTITVATFILIVGFIFSAYNFWISRKKDIKDDSTQFIKVNFKLDDIGKTTNDIKAEVSSLNKQIDDMKEKQIIQGQEIKALWRNVDKLNNKE